MKANRFALRRDIFRFQVLAVPAVLFLITFLAYGLFAFQQGFHWDDWGFAWMPVTYGLPGLVKYYSYDRPLLAYFVYLTTSWIGPHPLAWQIFGMLARWASALTLWWTIRVIQPNRKRLAFWTSAFFLLYPGFRQQTIANAYGHYLWVEACFFLSLGLMLKAVESKRYRRLLMIASLILALPNLFLTEYFAGFEIVRPFLLWFALGKENPNVRQRIRKFAWYYLPFIFIFVVFLYWRFFIARSLRYGIDVNAGEVASISTLGGLIATVLSQWLTVSVNAWLQIFQLPSAQDFGIRLILLYALILIAALEGWVYFSKRLADSERVSENSKSTTPSSHSERSEESQVFIRRSLFQNRDSSLPAVARSDINNGFQKRSDEADVRENSNHFDLRLWLAIGFIAILGAQIPFLLSQLTIKLQFPYDRFTLPFALGVSLILAGGLELIPNLTRRSLIAGLLVALAIGFQIQTSFAFRADWNLVKYYLWQLTWRVPGLQPGTVLLSSDMPFQYSSDNSLTAPVNWIYNPGPHSGSMQYLNWDIDVRAKSGQLDLAPGQPVQSDFRVTTFTGTTDHAVVIAYQPPGCVRVLNPQYDQDLWVAPKSVTDAAKIQTLPFLDVPYLTAQAMPLSNMDQIIPNPAQLAKPMDFLYPEPPHNWCYYFEKADLARQLGDWKQVAKIGDQAFAVPYHADDLSEYLPFIEAYARLGRWKDARDLTLTTSASMPLLKPELCSLWTRLRNDSSVSAVQDAGNQISKVLSDLNCFGK